MTVAAIDCGTNSVRLLVARLPASYCEASASKAAAAYEAASSNEPFTELTRRMEIVRLGQGVDRTGRLAPDALERTRLVLADYASQIGSFGVDRVRMVATSATRDADNAQEFRDMVQATVGVTPEVVTGEEEARLSFVGAVRGLPVRLPAPYLVVDIGGGSTELVLGSLVLGSQRVDSAISVDIGCVRMTERHLHDDPPTREQIEAAYGDITSHIDEALGTVDGRCARTLVGLAGSVTTVTALVLGLSAYQPECIHHAQVQYDDVARVCDELLSMSRAQRLALPAMHPGRADVIGAGALILRVVMQRTGADQVVASEHDILDGIAWSLAV
jgi:exopolyphosphatase / guanosine-5'-triphosphate,3'-diphosphate pyrophosphatase